MAPNWTLFDLRERIFKRFQCVFIGFCKGVRVQGSRLGVQGSGSRVQGSGFKVQGSGFRVQGSGFRVERSRPCRSNFFYDF